jgi:hypothetical protein
MENNEVTKRFDDYISRKTFEGYTIMDKNSSNHSATLKKEGAKFNHTLHAILTFFTCFWGIVWLIKWNGRTKDSRIRVSFDNSGNLIEEEVKN